MKLLLFRFCPYWGNDANGCFGKGRQIEAEVTRITCCRRSGQNGIPRMFALWNDFPLFSGSNLRLQCDLSMEAARRSSTHCNPACRNPSSSEIPRCSSPGCLRFGTRQIPGILANALRVAEGSPPEGVRRSCRKSWSRSPSKSESLTPGQSPPVGRSARIGAPFIATRRKFRESLPIRLGSAYRRRGESLPVGPNRFPATPGLKCYSSCYSLIRVLEAFRVGWCRMASRAVLRQITANV